MKYAKAYALALGAYLGAVVVATLSLEEPTGSYHLIVAFPLLLGVALALYFVWAKAARSSWQALALALALSAGLATPLALVYFLLDPFLALAKGSLNPDDFLPTITISITYVFLGAIGLIPILPITSLLLLLGRRFSRD